MLAGRRRWDTDAWGWPAGEIELRTFAGGQFLGRFMLRPRSGSGPSLQARLVAVTLAGLAARVLRSAQPARDDS